MNNTDVMNGNDDNIRSNIISYRPRGNQLSRRRVLALAGDGNRSDLITFNTPSNDEEKLRLTRIHIGMAREIFKSKGIPFTSANEERILGALAGTPASSEAIFAIVQSEATAITNGAVANPDFKTELDKFGITHGDYHNLARAGFSSYSAMLDAMARFGRAKAAGFTGTAADWANGNMSGTQAALYGGSDFSGNLSSIGLVNYLNAGRQFYATGMTYGTFDHLRAYMLPDGQKFTGTNILHAGQDAVAQKFSANDRIATRNLAALDHFDPAGRDTRTRIVNDMRARITADPVTRKLLADLDKADTPEAIAAARAAMEQHRQSIQTDSGWANYTNGLPPAAQPFAQSQGARTYYDQFGKLAAHDPALRDKLEQSSQAVEASIGLDTPAARGALDRQINAARHATGDDPDKLAALRAYEDRLHARVAIADDTRTTTVIAALDVKTAQVDVKTTQVKTTAEDTELAALAPTAPTKRASAERLPADGQQPAKGETQATAFVTPPKAEPRTTAAEPAGKDTPSQTKPAAKGPTLKA